MKFAWVTLSVAVLTAGLFVGSAQARARKVEQLTHTGTVVSATAGSLVMTGRNGKEHTHTLAKDAKVMIDGKPGTMAGLKKGMHVSVTTDGQGTATAVSTLVTPPVKPAVTTKPASTTPAKPATLPKPATPAKSASK